MITPQIVGLDETTWRSQPQQIGHGYALDLETFDSWWLPLKKLREVKESRQSFFESPALVGCALAVGRELYDRLWGFDAGMRQWGNEDLDFALKAWTMGARVLHDPVATVAHRFQRQFTDYEVTAEYPLANQIRAARKHFTQSVWGDWVLPAQQQQGLRLKDHPEGLWASAWEIFQRDRQSAEHERAYLLSRRTQDEFWFAKKFDRSWPTMGGDQALLKQAPLPPHVLFAEAMATPAFTIVHETAATQPDDQTRTTIGVGEAVNLSLSNNASANWTVSGNAQVGPSSGATAVMTAGDQDTDITLTATVGNDSSSVTFTVVLPTLVSMVAPSDGSYIHNVNRPDVGFCASVYVGPATVNFLGMEVLEEQAHAVATGVYSEFNGSGHQALNPVGFTGNISGGLGSEVSGSDTIYSGYPTPNPPFEPGLESLSIPWDFVVPWVGTNNAFNDVQSYCQLESDETTLVAFKAGAEVTIQVSSASMNTDIDC